MWRNISKCSVNNVSYVKHETTTSKLSFSFFIIAQRQLLSNRMAKIAKSIFFSLSNQNLQQATHKLYIEPWTTEYTLTNDHIFLFCQYSIPPSLVRFRLFTFCMSLNYTYKNLMTFLRTKKKWTNKTFLLKFRFEKWKKTFRLTHFICLFFFGTVMPGCRWQLHHYQFSDFINFSCVCVSLVMAATSDDSSHFHCFFVIKYA